MCQFTNIECTHHHNHTHTHTQTERGKRPLESTGPVTKNPTASSGKLETKKNGASAASAKPDSDDSDSEYDD